MNLSLKAHLLWRQLRQAVWIDDIFVNKEAAPTAFDRVEMFPVKWNAWTNDPHVALAIVTDRLAGTEWDTMLAFQNYLLLEQEVLQLSIGRKLEAQWAHDLLEEIVQRPFP
jgi:hypothetical protein